MATINLKHFKKIVIKVVIKKKERRASKASIYLFSHHIESNCFFHLKGYSNFVIYFIFIAIKSCFLISRPKAGILYICINAYTRSISNTVTFLYYFYQCMSSHPYLVCICLAVGARHAHSCSVWLILCAIQQ